MTASGVDVGDDLDEDITTAGTHGLVMRGGANGGRACSATAATIPCSVTAAAMPCTGTPASTRSATMCEL